MALNLPPPPATGAALDRWLNLVWKKLTGSAQIAVSQISGMGSGVSTFLETPSSANLASAVTGETGSGALVFGTSPTLGGTVTVTGGGEISFSSGGSIFSGGDMTFASVTGNFSMATTSGNISLSAIDVTLDQQTGTLQLGSGGPVVLVSASAPSSATDTGQTGEIRADSNYIYYCVTADTWKRAALSSW